MSIETPIKQKDPGSLTIPYVIGSFRIEQALLDLGASVNLLPYTVYKQLGLGELKSTNITLQSIDRSVKVPRGMLENILIKVGGFIFPIDFVVLCVYGKGIGRRCCRRISAIS